MITVSLYAAMQVFVVTSETSVTLFLAPSLEVAEICGECDKLPELIIIYKLIKYYVKLRLSLSCPSSLVTLLIAGKIWFFRFLITFQYLIVFLIIPYI